MTNFIIAVIMALFSQSALAWTFELNFEQVAVGQNCPFDDGATQSFISAARASNGSRSCELNISKGDTGFGRWGGIMYLPTHLVTGDEIWVRVKTFMPVGFDYDSTSGGNRLKFLRVHTASAGNSNEGYNDIYINPASGPNPEPFRFIFEGAAEWIRIGSPADKIVRGVWETYELYLHLDSVAVDSGGLGRMRFWKNGILLVDATHRPTLKGSSSYANSFYLFTYWNGGAPQTQKMFVDEIAVSSTTPPSVDAQGNPYFGVGKTGPRPNPPTMAP